jgi:hypothetical protein
LPLWKCVVLSGGEWRGLAGRSQRLGILVGPNYIANANGTVTLFLDMFDALSDVLVADTDVAGALGQRFHALRPPRRQQVLQPPTQLGANVERRIAANLAWRPATAAGACSACRAGGGRRPDFHVPSSVYSVDILHTKFSTKHVGGMKAYDFTGHD